MRFMLPAICGALVALFPASAWPSEKPEGDSRDPVISGVPIDEWLSDSGQAHFRWSARLSEPRLSVHQRLTAIVEITVDGAEAAKRRGRGELLMLIQFESQNGHKWQTHDSVDLETLAENAKSNQIVYTQPFFVLPGDYRVSIVVADTATREHSVIRKRFHVAPLKPDPLADAWRDLPDIEFLQDPQAPDNLFLPSITGRLSLPVETKRPVHVDVLVNLTPTERLSGSAHVESRNLGLLLPAMKVISQIDLDAGSLDISLIDMSRHKVAFEQRDVKDFDWESARGNLTQSNPGIIDIKELRRRRYNAEFLQRQIARRAAAETEGSERAVIVLSGPVAFEAGEELHAIQIDSRPHAKLFYIRYQPPRGSYFPPRQRGRGQIGFGRGAIPPPIVDEIAPTLKPLEPKIFDVDSPDQFRKALASILSELARM